MFVDMAKSADVLTRFRDSDQGADYGQFSVQTLTLAHWPTHAATDVAVPAAVQRFQRAFGAHYDGANGGRRLVWVHALGTVTLKVAFPRGRKELDVSALQATVLMLFNRHPLGTRLPFETIRDETQMEDALLRTTLQSLACAEVKPLRKSPKSRDIKDGDEFEVNAKFKSDAYRIKVNSIQMRETRAEQQATTAGINQDRRLAIDAAIVRIMKARKTLRHAVLIAELAQQLRFPVRPADLKVQIESLVERDYLERAEGERNLYNYLA